MASAAAQKRNAENVKGVPVLAAVYTKDWQWRQGKSRIYPASRLPTKPLTHRPKSGDTLVLQGLRKLTYASTLAQTKYKPGGQMDAQAIRQLRKQMGLSQAQLGSLVNAHFVTVSKWESGSGDAAPDSYQLGMLQRFAAIEQDKLKQMGNEVKNALIAAGVIAALFLLLEAAAQK